MDPWAKEKRGQYARTTKCDTTRHKALPCYSHRQARMYIFTRSPRIDRILSTGPGGVNPRIELEPPTGPARRLRDAKREGHRGHDVPPSVRPSASGPPQPAIHEASGLLPPMPARHTTTGRQSVAPANNPPLGFTLFPSHPPISGTRRGPKAPGDPLASRRTRRD